MAGCAVQRREARKAGSGGITERVAAEVVRRGPLSASPQFMVTEGRQGLTRADVAGCAVERREARKACSRGIPEPVTADVANRGTVRWRCRPSGASMLCAAPMRLPATSCASADACTGPYILFKDCCYLPGRPPVVEAAICAPSVLVVATITHEKTRSRHIQCRGHLGKAGLV